MRGGGRIKGAHCAADSHTQEGDLVVQIKKREGQAPPLRRGKPFSYRSNHLRMARFFWPAGPE